MIFHVWHKSVPGEFPDPFGATHRSNATLPPCGLLLLGLFLLCLAPRAFLAGRLTSICPDGVLYFRMADAFEHGVFPGMFSAMRFNVYPVVLMILHQVGVPWEQAGAGWNVFIASCTVLPLYGWIRRQFDDGVAVAACLLYAVHPVLIRWSPEIVRDPTFWFLFAMSLYLAWRAVTEVYWLWFVSAGMAISLACLTRFEGLVLLVPLVLWALWRGLGRPAVRTRLLVGTLACVSVYPLVLVLLSTAWSGVYAAGNMVRSEPLNLARGWAQAAWSLDDDADADEPQTAGLSPHHRISAWRMVQRFVPGLVKGMSPLVLVCLLGGLTGWWRTWLRRDHQPLFFASLIVLMAIWVHLWWSHEAGQRYFLSPLLMALPFAGLGLLRFSAAVADRVNRFKGLAGAMPVLLIAAVSLSLVLGGDYRFRRASVELGQWTYRQFGPSARLFGPSGVTQVINYYAKGRCDSFEENRSDRFIATCVEKLHPDLVMLPAVRKTNRGVEGLLREIEDLGFEQVDRSRFSGGCGKVLVLARRRGEDRG